MARMRDRDSKLMKQRQKTHKKTIEELNARIAELEEQVRDQEKQIKYMAIQLRTAEAGQAAGGGLNTGLITSQVTPLVGVSKSPMRY